MLFVSKRAGKDFSKFAHYAQTRCFPFNSTSYKLLHILPCLNMEFKHSKETPNFEEKQHVFGRQIRSFKAIDFKFPQLWFSNFSVLSKTSTI